MGVASCSRTRTHQYNMVAQTTLVVFTIVLAATGVFVPEAGRELEESDGNNVALNPAQTILNSGHLVKMGRRREKTVIRQKKETRRGKVVNVDHQRRTRREMALRNQKRRRARR